MPTTCANNQDGAAKLPMTIKGVAKHAATVLFHAALVDSVILLGLFLTAKIVGKGILLTLRIG